MERLLGVQEVSDLLSVKRSTIRAWIFQGKIPYIRVGRLIRFRSNDLERWLNDQQKDEN